jgi:hypothetical protein
MVFYLLTGAAAVAAGSRFFGHYYLFLLVPLSALYAFGTYWIVRMVGTLLSPARLERILRIQRPPQPLAAGLTGLAMMAAGVVLVLPAANLAWMIPAVKVGLPQREPFFQSMSKSSRVPALFLELADPGWQPDKEFMKNFVWLPNQELTDAIHAGEHLKTFLRPGDTLFVWGWKPEIYAISQALPATSFVTCNSIARDFTRGIAVTNIDREALGELMRKLTDRPPSIIVNAASASHSMRNIGILEPEKRLLSPYSLEYYPEFRDFLRKHYHPFGSLGGYRFYRRNDSESA